VTRDREGHFAFAQLKHNKANQAPPAACSIQQLSLCKHKKQ